MKSAPLVITFCDSGYLPLLEIWLQRLRELEVPRVRVFCLDRVTLEWCTSQGVAASPVSWSGELRNLWVQRIAVFSQLLAEGEPFVHSDIDAVWIRNPLETGAACSRKEDLLFSQGTVWPPDVHARWGFVLCCGWFRGLPTPAAQDFFRALQAHVIASGDDQLSVNRLLLSSGGRWSQGPVGEYALPFRDRQVQCWSQPLRLTTSSGSLSVALLPHREFQRLPEETDRAIVKHYLTPKSCAQKLRALQHYGLLPISRLFADGRDSLRPQT